jgi:uncharacterized protein YaiI (UPF0178 family)
MSTIYVDADACPVKDEIYKVALRYDLEVLVVANQWMFTPDRGRVKFVRVDDGFDAADDWIAERAGAGDVVVTTDIPLAARCIQGGAHVLSPKGKEFKESTIGGAMASREMLAEMREMGIATGGPAPFDPRDRSRFLGKLDEILQRIRRRS